MKNVFKNLLSALLITFSAFLCSAQQIPYQLANNYFVNNTYPDEEINVIKITSLKDFNEVFGMAATMGNDGQPTEIDFKNNFVVAVIDSENKVTESIYIKDLRIERKKLNLRYGLKKRMQPSSASFRSAKILIINKDHRKAKVVGDYSRIDSEIPDQEKVTDELQCHPSISFIWSILEKKCIRPISTKYTFIGENFNTSGNAGLQFDRRNTQAEIMDSSLAENLILDKKGENDVWTDGNYKLEQLKKDLFILKKNDKEIAIGKLRN